MLRSESGVKVLNRKQLLHFHVMIPKFDILSE